MIIRNLHGGTKSELATPLMVPPPQTFCYQLFSHQLFSHQKTDKLSRRTSRLLVRKIIRLKTYRVNYFSFCEDDFRGTICSSLTRIGLLTNLCRRENWYANVCFSCIAQNACREVAFDAITNRFTKARHTQYKFSQLVYGSSV